MRYDKYDGKAGGFRAPLDFDVAPEDAFTPFGVGLNANGRLVKGAGNTGIRGLLITHEAATAGSVYDVMTAGECVEAGLAAGTSYTANTNTGAISNAAASATQIDIGCTVEAKRLVVRRA
jgi:hypothetical protein